jgi:hypothetical protein
MAKDEQTEGADLSQENSNDTSTDTSQENQDNGQQDGGQSDGAQDEGSQEDDYQAKLNATNRFLKKEGYEFKDGRWQKKASGQAQHQQQQAQATPGLTREEGILFAKGFSEEEVEQAKKVASLQGVKLTEAVTDELFTGWKAKKDKEAKDRQAQLGVSRGARPATKKTFATQGLSDEDHKQLFQEKMQG